jgi:hypothetical protein
MKTSRRYILSLSMFIIWAFMLSCVHIGDSNAINGNREYTKVERVLSNYTKVEVQGDFEIELNPSFNEKVIIDADSNLHNYIYTEVENETLKITSPEKKALRSFRDIKIEIGAKSLTHIVLAGANNVSCSAVLVFDSLHLEIAGASKGVLELSGKYLTGSFPGAVTLELKGFVNNMDVDVAGAAKFNASELQVANCQISLAGAGKADVFVTDTLDVNIAGVGLVSYKGNPQKIYSSIGGIGKLQQAD